MPLSETDARREALLFLGGEDLAEIIEVLNGTTDDHPYAVYTAGSRTQEESWIIVVRFLSLYCVIDGPVEVVWVSKKTGKVIQAGTGQSGG
jgi:hypothetical protein